MYTCGHVCLGVSSSGWAQTDCIHACGHDDDLGSGHRVVADWSSGSHWFPNSRMELRCRKMRMLGHEARLL